MHACRQAGGALECCLPVSRSRISWHISCSLLTGRAAGPNSGAAIPVAQLRIQQQLWGPARQCTAREPAYYLHAKQRHIWSTVQARSTPSSGTSQNVFQQAADLASRGVATARKVFSPLPSGFPAGTHGVVDHKQSLERQSKSPAWSCFS